MEVGNKSIYDGRFRGNILVVGKTAWGKTYFLQKLGLNKFFGKLIKTEWVTDIEIDDHREAEINKWEDGGEELRRWYNNLRRPIIPSNDNNEEELFCRYNNLKAPLNNDEELLRRYNDLRTPLFKDIPSSPPLPLKRTDTEKDYDDTSTNPHCWSSKNRFLLSYKKSNW